MNGAESLLRTLAANGIELCFMNPGTSEMHFVAALDRAPGVRGVLCLFEGVCSGAADGYARMKGTPAATLLHLGPGLANGLSNFHNARKARSPIVSIVGEHSLKHLEHDAPLSADIEAFARTVSSDVRVATSPSDVGQALSETIAAAIAPPGQVGTLIVPADLSWSEGGVCGPIVPRPRREPPPEERIREAARLLRSPGTALLLGGTAVNDKALAAAGRLAAHTGSGVFADRNTARLASGRGRFHPKIVPYFPEPALASLAGVRNLILVETQAPVSFFGYPGTPSSLLPDGMRGLGVGRPHTRTAPPRSRRWPRDTGPRTYLPPAALLLPKTALCLWRPSVQPWRSSCRIRRSSPMKWSPPVRA